MFEAVKSGVQRVKNLPYKKAAVIGAVGILALSGGSYTFKQYQQVDAIVQSMNSSSPDGKKLADDMVKNGLAEQIYTIVDPKGYIVFDKEVGVYHSSSLKKGELDKKISAAKEFNYQINAKFVLLDKPTKN